MTLLAFAVLAAFASAGDHITQVLLTACLKPDFSPIVLEDNRALGNTYGDYPPDFENFASESGITLEDLPEFGEGS